MHSHKAHKSHRWLASHRTVRRHHPAGLNINAPTAATEPPSGLLIFKWESLFQSPLIVFIVYLPKAHQQHRHLHISTSRLSIHPSFNSTYVEWEASYLAIWLTEWLGSRPTAQINPFVFKTFGAEDLYDAVDVMWNRVCTVVCVCPLEIHNRTGWVDHSSCVIDGCQKWTRTAAAA